MLCCYKKLSYYAKQRNRIPQQMEKHDKEIKVQLWHKTVTIIHCTLIVDMPHFMKKLV